jgi:hypothetical protein
MVAVILLALAGLCLWLYFMRRAARIRSED